MTDLFPIPREDETRALAAEARGLPGLAAHIRETAARFDHKRPRNDLDDAIDAAVKQAQDAGPNVDAGTRERIREAGKAFIAGDAMELRLLTMELEAQLVQWPTEENLERLRLAQIEKVDAQRALAFADKAMANTGGKGPAHTPEELSRQMNEPVEAFPGVVKVDVPRVDAAPTRCSCGSSEFTRKDGAHKCCHCGLIHWRFIASPEEVREFHIRAASAETQERDMDKHTGMGRFGRMVGAERAFADSIDSAEVAPPPPCIHASLAILAELVDGVETLDARLSGIADQIAPQGRMPEASGTEARNPAGPIPLAIALDRLLNRLRNALNGAFDEATKIQHGLGTD